MLSGSVNLKMTGFLSMNSLTMQTSVGSSSQMYMKNTFFERFQFNTGFRSGYSNASSPLMVHTYRRNGHILLFCRIVGSFISTSTGQKSPFSLYWQLAKTLYSFFRGTLYWIFFMNSLAVRISFLCILLLACEVFICSTDASNTVALVPSPLSYVLLSSISFGI